MTRRADRHDSGEEEDEIDPLLLTVSTSELESRMSAELVTPRASCSDTGAFWGEVKSILLLAGPLALQDVLLLLQDTISVAFVGRIDKTALSCMTLASTTFNVAGLSLVMGFASGAETLAGQCFGARNYAALGVTLQKSLLITWLLCIAVVGLWTQMGSLLLATGQDKVIVDISMKLVWLRLPALFLLAVIECLKRYLMAQGIVTPACLAYVATTVLTGPINWICIFGLGLGIEGSSIANDITCLLNCVLLLGIVVYYNKTLAGTGRQTWEGWSKDCLKRWGQYYRLAIPSTVMLCLEWWTFETIILMTGLLPDADVNLGVVGILFQLGGLCYMIPIGLQGAASTRVSNELGRSRPFVARKAVMAAVSTGLFTQSCISVLVFLFRHQLGYVLSSDADVVARVADIIPIMCLMIMLDGCNAVSSGVIRGCGRQVTAACTNLATFWGVGVPLAAVLGFKTALAVKGLWLGVAAAVWAQFASMMILMTCLDWKREAERAAHLVNSNKKLDDLDIDDDTSEHTLLKNRPSQEVL